MNQCTGQPLSWLLLERHALGELPPAQQPPVEAHLSSCPACRGCFESICADQVVLPVLPLPAVEPRQRAAWPLGRLAWALSGAAALVVFVVLGLVLLRPTQIPGNRIITKGGEIAISLVRERAGTVLHDPRDFAPRDRFQVLVTCPPGQTITWDLVVFQDGAASFPLDAAGTLPCGNRVPLPGAFRLTGRGQAVVCLVVGDAERPALERRGLRALPADSVCQVLDPAP